MDVVDIVEAIYAPNDSDADWLRGVVSAARPPLRDWRVLVRARWSLVDHFETNGERYVVARLNPPESIVLGVLAPRERHVLAYAAAGHSNKLIAYDLGISPSTVRVLFSRLMAKLNLDSREDAIACWRNAWAPRTPG